MSNPGEGYVIPFGADGGQYNSEIDTMVDKTEYWLDAAVDANKAVQSEFVKSGAAADRFGAQLAEEITRLKGLQSTAQGVGKELADAFNGKKVSADFENKLKTITKVFTDLQSRAKINIQADPVKLKALEAELSKVTDEFKQLAIVVDFAKQQLNELTPDSAEWQQFNAQIQLAEEFLKGLGDATDQVTTKEKTLKSELRQLKADLAAMELAGEGATQEFKEMAQRAGELEDQIGDVSARVKVLASDTKYLDAGIEAVTGLVGVFTAAQGAAALLGEENEDVALAIQKITAAMAILQGIQAIANTLNKDSAVSVLFLSRAQAQATVTTTALAGATAAEAAATVTATTATNTFTAALLANPFTAILALLAAAAVALYAFASASDDAEESAEDLTRAIERQRAALALDQAALERRTELLVAMAKASGASESQITKVETEGLRKRLAIQEQEVAALQTLHDDRAAFNTRTKEEQKKLTDDLTEAEQERLNLVNQIRISELEGQAQANKERKELQKKRIEDLKKAQEQEKAQREQLAKFIAAAESAELDAMEEGTAKQIAAAQKAAAEQLRELNSQVALTKDAAAARLRATLQIENALTVEIARIQKEAAKKRAELLLTGQQELARMQEDGISKELVLLRLEGEQREAQIRENYAKETELRDKLLAALKEELLRRENELTKEAGLQRLAEEEKVATASAELVYNLGEKTIKAEREKNRNLLAIQADYAQRRLDFIRTKGAAETDAEVVELKALIAKLKAELAGELEQTGGFNLVSFLGLDDLTEDQLQAVKDAAKSIMSSLSEVTRFAIQQADEQIRAQQKVVSEYNKQVEDLKKQLDKEKELRDNGFANNVDRLEKELEVKQRARDEEVKREQELTAKKRQLQKVQNAIDTASQASNLITAAAKIYNSVSQIPFVGVALATGLVAAMIGAFVAAKAMAANAVSSSDSFGEGGLVDGKSHAAGGRKYRSSDGKHVRELEGGEYVTNTAATARHLDLLEAINGGASDMDLAALLHGTGVHIDHTSHYEGLEAARTNDGLKIEVAAQDDPVSRKALQQIEANTTELVRAEQERAQTWWEGDTFCVKVGNKTTKTKKRK
jgi:hypothetical protein